MKFLNKEINTKKTVKQEIIESVISAICFAIVIYFCLTLFNEDILSVLESIKTGKVSALNVTLILFPIFLIVSVMIKLAIIVGKPDSKK